MWFLPKRRQFPHEHSKVLEYLYNIYIILVIFVSSNRVPKPQTRGWSTTKVVPRKFWRMWGLHMCFTHLFCEKLFQFFEFFNRYQKPEISSTLIGQNLIIWNKFCLMTNSKLTKKRCFKNMPTNLIEFNFTAMVVFMHVIYVNDLHLE